MAGKRKENPILKEKLSNLKQKQDKWMKERSQSLNNPKINQLNNTSSMVKKTPNASIKGTVKKPTDALLWNTGAKSTAYTGFVVRKNSGMETDRSQRSSRPHSSLKSHVIDNSSSPKKPTQTRKLNNSTGTRNLDSSSGTLKLNSSDDANEVVDETLSIKLNDYFSKLDVTDTSPIQSLCASFYDQANSRDSKRKTMANHTCQLCQQVMNNNNCIPNIVYPCAHSFCSLCLSGQKYCPDCNCVIMSVEENSTLLKVIQQFQEQQAREQKAQQENEAKKYINEYKSLVTRAKVMKEEASAIIDKMENFTHEIVKRKNNLADIQKDASDTKKQMIILQEKLNSLEKQHISEVETIQGLEEDYESYKKQLLMAEKTIKTICQSKERVKMMMENIAPSICFDDDGAD